MVYGEMMADNVSKGQRSMSANNRSRGLKTVDTCSLSLILFTLLFHTACSLSLLVFLGISFFIFDISYSFCNTVTDTCELFCDKLLLIATGQNVSTLCFTVNIILPLWELGHKNLINFLFPWHFILVKKSNDWITIQ